MNRQQVFICGGGHQGLAMAAHLSLSGVPVSLWNRTRSHIQNVIEEGVIHCSGIISGSAHINAVSDRMEEVISDFIMVTTPSLAHKDIAKQIAPFVHRDMVIILNPGRTFGAIEFLDTLKECGVSNLPHIAETQTIVYTCRRSTNNHVVIYVLKEGVEIASVKGDDLDYIMERIPNCLRGYFKPVDSVFQTSLSNVGMVLHCAPVLMNIGCIESDSVEFKYYYNGISKTVAKFLEKVDSERLLVAEKLGFHVESTAQWLRRTYQVSGASLYSCLRNNQAYREIDAPNTIQHRYILEDVPNGLVPIEDTAHKLNLDIPYISLIIDLACAVMECDFRKNGRKYRPL